MKPSELSVRLAGSSPDNRLARVIAMAPAPVLMGEDEADYAGLAARVVGVSGPRDAIEELLLRDVIDLTWEILRLRRLKAGLLRASMSAGVSQVLETVGYPYFQSERLSSGLGGGSGEGAQAGRRRSRRRRAFDSGGDGEDVREQDRGLRADRPDAGERGGAAKQRAARNRPASGGGGRRRAPGDRRSRGCRIQRGRGGRSGRRARRLTSVRKWRANRANATASTGPRTKAGRARSARNAFRHGLNISVLSEPALAPRAEALARGLACPDLGAEGLEWARRIAEAQVDLDRVRLARRQAIERMPCDPPDGAPSGDPRMVSLLGRVLDRLERRSGEGGRGRSHPPGASAAHARAGREARRDSGRHARRACPARSLRAPGAVEAQDGHSRLRRCPLNRQSLAPRPLAKAFAPGAYAYCGRSTKRYVAPPDAKLGGAFIFAAAIVMARRRQSYIAADTGHRPRN